MCSTTKVVSNNLKDKTQRGIKETQSEVLNKRTTESDSLLTQRTQDGDTIPPLTSSSDSLLLNQGALSVDSTSVAISTSALVDVMNYEASDSITFDMREEKLSMYRQSKVLYQSNQIESGVIDLLLPLREVEARPLLDSLGKNQEEPVLTEKNSSYFAKYIRYNFHTKRTLIKGVVTQHGEAYIHGEQIKAHSDKSTYVKTARYTTCNYRRPHFHFRARRLKILPGKTLSAPFHMRVGDTPLPIGFPFGFFAKPQKKASGLLTPRYGEERTRGFFLRNLGYYFAINPYMDLNAQIDVYTRGSLNGATRWRYLQRYSYEGDMNLRYSYVQGGFGSNREEYWVNWEHRPRSRGDSRFSASVNAGSSNYNAVNYQNNVINTQTRFSSNINYSKTFTATPFSTNLSLRHQQNVEKKQVELSLPEFSWNMRSIYPLSKLVRSQQSPLKKFSISHSMQARNEISNAPRGTQPIKPFSLDNFPLLLREARNGAQHQIPISMPLTVLRYFTLTPSFSYSELWYLQHLRHTYDQQTSTIKADTVKGFSRASHWSVSNGFTTRRYGTFFFRQGSTVQALRHVFIPSLSLSYRPDFARPRHGVYTPIQTPTGERYVSKYDGFVFGTTPQGEAASMGVQLSNQFEMKLRSRADSTGKGYRKVRLLDNLSFSSSYNFLADSFALSTINASARTSLFKNMVVISSQAIIDPYVWREKNGTWQRTPQYAWQGGQDIGTLTSFSTNVGISLKPKSKKSRSSTKKDQNSGQKGDQAAQLLGRSEEYVDFSVPWNLRINYNIRQQRRGRAEPQTIQSLNLSGGLNITPSTRINLSSGYDLKAKELTQTSMSFIRDLHCWEIVGTWVPFGRFTNYEITIQAKSVLLQGLKMTRRRSFFDALSTL